MWSPWRRWPRQPSCARQFPDLKIRFVNVVDLFKLKPATDHPHGLTDRDFDSLFTTDKPVIFNFHGYPALIHKLAYRRANHDNMHVRGYNEKGSIDTPLALTILNQVDRFSLAIDVIDRVPRLQELRSSRQGLAAGSDPGASRVCPRARHRSAGDPKLEMAVHVRKRRDRAGSFHTERSGLMAVTTPERTTVDILQDKATRLRIDSVRSTTAAGSGHPTSCASAAEIMSVLFYSVLRYDPRDPHNRDSDVFVLSKGHAAPILYAAWAEAGAFPREKLLTLRQIDSDLEGHPTPQLPFIDVATGSLGQGLSVSLGIALHAKRFGPSDQRVYVLMGDGESAEGSVWEAAQWATLHDLSNLCATIDINRLGQSQPTMLQRHLDIYKARWEAFGWQALSVDGHSIPHLQAALRNRSSDHRSSNDCVGENDQGQRICRHRGS